MKRIEKQANQDATRDRKTSEKPKRGIVRRLQEKGRELNLDPSFAAANESHSALFASIAAVPDPVPVCPRQRRPACSFGSGQDQQVVKFGSHVEQPDLQHGVQ